MSEVICNDPEVYHEGQVERIDAVDALNLAKYQQREAREAMKTRLLNWGAWFRIGNDTRKDTGQITSSTLGKLMDTAIPQPSRKYEMDEEDAQLIHDQIATMKKSKHVQYAFLMMRYARRGLDGKPKYDENDIRKTEEVLFEIDEIADILNIRKNSVHWTHNAALDNLVMSGV